MTAPTVFLRPAREDDVPTFFAHQCEPAACAMAVWESRDWQACSAHWQRILSDPSVNTHAVLLGGNLAGYVGAFDREGKREVCYWIGTAFWGRGVASAALGAFLATEPARPLLARVAESNSASIRVLEKHGFDVESRQIADDGVAEIWLVLKG